MPNQLPLQYAPPDRSPPRWRFAGRIICLIVGVTAAALLSLNAPKDGLYDVGKVLSLPAAVIIMALDLEISQQMRCLIFILQWLIIGSVIDFLRCWQPKRREL